MAFHVACPITCRRICYCSLGFRKKKGEDETLNEKLNLFLGLVKDDNDDKSNTVEVLVPKVAVVVRDEVSDVVVADGDVAKRAALQKEAAAASIVAEDFARRFESGEAVGNTQDVAGEEQVLSNGKVMCRLCFSGEYERTERARRMLSCKSCNKKYHRSCLKAWSHDRDLFHWSSWTCPSCRVCEVCQKTGDPNKLMFCKRCDGAYHCYCQHPPHKNVSRGPYLCPKHTRCHSCSSTVPGNGSSLRWFLGYTCCDACGRLFVKGNYCPVCLKVYRDSESTPMVCCDICQRWVHCHCDGISDEKYMQFQVDNHLKYSCATCRGECYQVRDLEDAVQELWRRRDKADQTLIIRLRAAAGLPIQDEIFNISPYSDSEDDGPPLKKEYGHSLKFSLKGVVDKSPKKNKDSMKKSSNNKYGKEKGFLSPGFGRIEYSDAQSIGSLTGDNKDEDVQSRRNGEPETARLTDGVWPVDRTEAVKTKPVNEVSVKTDSRVLRDKQKNHRPHQLGAVDATGKEAVKSNNTKGPKLVIHLGARNKNVANSPRSDASNSLPEQVWTTPNGDNTDQADATGRNLRERGGNLITMKKADLEHSDVNSAGGGTEKTRITFGKRSMRRSAVTPGAAHEKALADLNDDNTGPPSVSHSSQKEPKPPLRLRFKNLYADDQSSWASPGRVIVRLHRLTVRVRQDIVQPVLHIPPPHPATHPPRLVTAQLHPVTHPHRLVTARHLQPTARHHPHTARHHLHTAQHLHHTARPRHRTARRLRHTAQLRHRTARLHHLTAQLHHHTARHHLLTVLLLLGIVLLRQVIVLHHLATVQLHPVTICHQLSTALLWLIHLAVQDFRLQVRIALHLPATVLHRHRILQRLHRTLLQALRTVPAVLTALVRVLTTAQARHNTVLVLDTRLVHPGTRHLQQASILKRVTRTKMDQGSRVVFGFFKWKRCCYCFEYLSVNH